VKPTDHLFKSGVLDPLHHARLVANLEEYIREAGCTVEDVTTSITDDLPPGVVEWCRLFRDDWSPGLLILGKIDPHMVMGRVAGWALRNYKDAKIRPLSAVMDWFYNDGPPEPMSFLLVPDFAIASDEMKADARMKLRGLLQTRVLEHKSTVLYAQSLTLLAKVHGTALASWINGTFNSMRID